MKKTLIICMASLLFAGLSSYGQLKTVAYMDGSQKLNGLAGIPKTASKKKAGVLILSAWMGITEQSKETAQKLTDLGYYAFVADIYGEGHYPKDMKEAAEQSGYYKSHVDNYQTRIKLAMDELIKQGADPSKIVVIGYCFGGTGALEAARANFPVKGVVSFHGGLGRDTTKPMTPVLPKVLVCHGAIDPYVPEQQVKAFQSEMKERKADWQMIYYANAVHSFTEVAAGNDITKGAAYNEKAAKRSWALMLQFLDEVFA